MEENRHTRDDLRYLQALPLALKIRLTEQRIREWVSEYGESGVYISFSGGKDSTVLLDIIRERMCYYNIPAMFVDVPTQYPELKEFVKTFVNVTILKPKISFREVCEKYGFPLISKEVSECVQGARKYLTSILEEQNALTDRQTDRQTIPLLVRSSCWSRRISETEEQDITITNTRRRGFLERSDAEALRRNSRGGGTTESIVESEELANLLNQRMVNKEGGNNQRLAIMLGMLTKDKGHPIKANIPSEDRSQFSLEQYKFFLEAPFEISNKCCNVMKKDPAHKYHKETGRNPITAQMAEESRLRTQKWLANGCNGFDLKIPTSNPMSFWTEQDVLQYIKLYDLPICEVYGEVVTDDEETGQMNLTDFDPAWDMGRVPLKTTGCDRTGCVLCGFGCHLEKYPSRFERLHETHPGFYDLLDRITNNGYTYRQAIEWVNEHGNLNIRL